MTHEKHRVVKTKERCFQGCASSNRCRPESHGGVTFVDVCSCGAQRETNYNAGYSERGQWYMPEVL